MTPQPALVGHTLEVTCLVRWNRPLSEVILYRDGVEVKRQLGNNPKFILSNLTTEDQGMYSCRASWDVHSQTYSVMSVDTPGGVIGESAPPHPIQTNKFNHSSMQNVFFSLRGPDQTSHGDRRQQ